VIVDTAALHALGAPIRQSLWLFPALETLHILGFALLYGSIVVVDLRLLGLGRGLSVSRLSALAVPWTIGAFALIVPTGLTMFVGHIDDYLTNPAFGVKMALVAAGVANAWLLRRGALRNVAHWDVEAPPPAGVRAAAAVSIVAWTGVIVCGRLIAYV
jgi:hypothetical protein